MTLRNPSSLLHRRIATEASGFLRRMAWIAAIPGVVGVLYLFVLSYENTDCLVFALPILAYAIGGFLLLRGYRLQEGGIPQSRNFWLASAFYQLPFLGYCLFLFVIEPHPFWVIPALWYGLVAALSLRQRNHVPIN